MMKTALSFLLLMAGCCQALAQDTTKILFIGNSFTYMNNMPWMVKAFADSAGITTEIAMHAPGGVSVGDISQGNMAHMNNPVLFSLIRSKKWDFVVIQDNQGRFVRDSAQFPTSSLVVQGHIRLMDSVKAQNSCAKIILFGGWAWKYGMPPFGNTGIECIQRILCNYRVLNDTMQEVIAPIGEAWIKGVNYLPAVNLWDTDDAHPSYAGSYLTASVIFSTIFNTPAKLLDYNGTITPATAYNLRAFADTAVFNATFHTKYNLGGVKTLEIQETGGQLLVPGSYAGYKWYQDGVMMGTSASLPASAAGDYEVIVQENDGCIVKSCIYGYAGPSTGIASVEAGAGISVYPNPVTGPYLYVNASGWQRVELWSITGVRQTIALEHTDGGIRVLTKGLTPGCYQLVLTAKDRVVRKTVMLCD